MCGRYAIDPRKLERLVRLLSLPEPKFTAHFNISPSQTVPVIRDAGNDPEWAMMRWGLIPHWAKEAKTTFSTFNARMETAAQKPAFRDAWKHRRCIIPATGFYEWQALESGKKQPWYFDSADGQALALAGLWDHWQDGSTSVDSCTILVGPPDPAVTGIHDRSPVLLGDSALPLWTSPALLTPDIPKVFALPHAGLKAQRVDRVAGDRLPLAN
ncbi:MAG: SOS response-associated peptidase [Acidithiobacillus sp.]|nr:SOS response-associated peptidase [Acidithiobacillus sp.]